MTKSLRTATAAVVAMGMGLLIAWPAQSATQAQIDEAWRKGIWWLFTNQSGDGFWKSTEGTQIATTALAIEALNNAPLKSYPFYKGVSWLSNVRAASTDSLARQAIALKLGGVNTFAHLSRLDALRNGDLAWGAYGQFDTSFPDTPLALSAMRIGLGQVVYPDLKFAVYCGVLPGQRTDGSWSYMPRPTTLEPTTASTGSVVPTAMNLLELMAIRTTNASWNIDKCNPNDPNGVEYSLALALTKGANWLLLKKNPANNGVGDSGVSSVVETAIAYRALKALGITYGVTATTLGQIEDYLLAQQNLANGSWGGDAFRTALVLSVLRSPSATIIADSDGDGIPNSVETLMGKNPAVRDSGSLAQGGGNTGPGLVLSSTMSARVFKDRPITIGLPITSGQGTFTWTILSGALPPGLTLNPAGTISGTPTTLGTFGFTYSVKDATSASSSTLGEIKVVPWGDWNGDGVVDGKDTAIVVNIINSILLDD
jgi:Putative Ig domain